MGAPKPSKWGSLRQWLDAFPLKRRGDIAVPSTFAAGIASALQRQGVQRKKIKFDELEAYAKVVWVYTPVFRLASAIASVPFRVYRGDPEGEHEEMPRTDPARRVLMNPNGWQSRYDLWEDTGIFLALKGEAPWQMIGVTPGAAPGSQGAYPQGIYVLRPDYLTPIPGSNTLIEKWEYKTPAESRPIVLAPDEVVMLKWRDPRTDYRGLSAIGPAEDAITQETAAIKLNAAQLENSGMLGLVLQEVAKDGVYQNYTREQLTALAEAVAYQVKNSRAFTTLAVGGGFEVKDVGTSSRDMQFVENRTRNREEMMAAVGVHPMMCGVLETASRLANASEQRESFWQDNVLPRLMKIEEALNSPTSGYFWRFGPDYFGAWDTSGVAALQESATEKAARYQIGFNIGAVTPNEFRAQVLGLEPDTNPALNAYYAPINLVQTGTSGMVSQRALAAPRKIYPRIDGLMRQVHWKLLDAQWRAYEQKWVKESRAFMQEQEDRVLGRLHRAGPIGLTADRIFPREEEEAHMSDGFEPLVAGTVAMGGRNGMRLVRDQAAEMVNRGYRLRGGRKQGEDDWEFDPLDPRVAQYTRALVQKLVRQVNETTWDRVRAELEEGQRGGETILELADRIGATLEQRRAQFELERIARTEVIKASNGGAMEAYRQSEVVDEKEWLATQDSRTREDHAEADGQRVALDEPFLVGASRLDFPGDPSGPPEEIINCRCTQVPVVELAP